MAIRTKSTSPTTRRATRARAAGRSAEETRSRRDPSAWAWDGSSNGSPSVARVTEITSASSRSFEDAIQAGIARASTTLDNVRGAWVQQMTVKAERGKVVEYRVNMKVTFVLND